MNQDCAWYLIRSQLHFNVWFFSVCLFVPLSVLIAISFFVQTSMIRIYHKSYLSAKGFQTSLDLSFYDISEYLLFNQMLQMLCFKKLFRIYIFLEISLFKSMYNAELSAYFYSSKR